MGGFFILQSPKSRKSKRGPQDDCFSVGSIWLAWIEYSPEKHCLQAVVYGDGNADDYGTSDDCTEKAFGCGSSLLVN